MANHKPLPELPPTTTRETNPTAGVLSVENRTHRSQLIHHVFNEVQEAGIAASREEWVRVFEDAMDDLSSSLASHNWLGSIKLEKEARLAQKAKERVAQGSEGSGIEDKTQSKESLPKVVDPIEHVRRLALKTPTVPRLNEPGHLLICVAPHGSTGPLPAEDHGFDLIPANIGCTFRAGSFSVDGILIGLRGIEGAVQLLGGTFAFRGLTSPEQHRILSKLLRFAVYVQLSMVLEQHLLKDSHIQLKLPRPKPLQPSISAPFRNDEDSSRGKPSLIPQGLLKQWNFFARKSLSRPGRAKTPDLVRGNSIDLGVLSDFSPITRLRRFSIVGERQSPSTPKPVEAPFETALKLVRGSRANLSTTAGVSFEPPLLLDHLAQKEKEHPKRRLKGDEKVGLRSLLGWEGRETHGKGMSGLAGFVRHQEISVLVTQHVPAAMSPEPSTSETDTLSLPSPSLKLCGKPQWRTYYYFSAQDDESLGQAILGLVEDCNLPCEQAACQYPRGKHQLRLVHAGVRINVTVDNTIVEGDEVSGIQSWESCAVCGASTKRTELSNGAWLLSFAKYLELLIYSPAICDIKPPICEHISPTTKYNILRNFGTQHGTVVFSVSPVEDVFELRVPRIQIRPGGEDITRNPTEEYKDSTSKDDVGHDEKKALRLEMREWWDGVWDHLQKLEEIILGDDIATLPNTAKPLPRLPSSDEPYDALDTVGTTFSSISGVTSVSSTSTPSEQALYPTPADGVKRQEYFSGAESVPPTIPEEPQGDNPSPTVPAKDVPPKDNSLEQLTKLLHSLQDLQLKLYIQLDKTSVSTLNDVRRSFLGVAQGTRKRILAWKKKHLGSKLALAGDLSTKEPQWWSKGCHAVPGTDILVREHDWGSIIAFTLSSKDYHSELVNLAFRRTTSQQTTPETPATGGVQSSFFSVASGYRFFTSQSNIQPDPDQDDAAWNDMEPFSSCVTRKDHTRDPTSLLSIRDVLRKGSVPASDPLAATSRDGTSPAPTVSATARAKPDVKVSMQEADGVVGVDETGETVEKLLHELEHSTVDGGADTPTTSRPGTAASASAHTKGDSSLTVMSSHTRTATAGSSDTKSMSGESEATIGKGGVAGAGKFVNSPSVMSLASTAQTAPPETPPKDPPQLPAKDGVKAKELPSTPQHGETLVGTASTFASTIASSLMKLVMSTPDPSSPTPSVSPNLNPPRRHGLLNTDIEAIEERPHIKYEWTIGKRLKFGCTVYYAKQFDSLRRRCGIDDMFVRSLSRSSNWAAEGGKSKSNFWKTSDDRFIIKTLVNAWNVADLQFLIDLGPAYFRYMEATANKATVLAKLLGFYTIEIKNLETGAVQSKVDLLVMENLFYDQNISKTFDLKGIQGRKVKASNADGGTTKTLFDGEWIEGQQKTLMLVQPHSKLVLQEAIRSDAEFLARSNIMDYSLLLGIDDTKKEICCGLVDTIGSYTFAKTLEYKAKHGLQSGSKEVTVMPPADYQERFVRALEGYFVACPDKWSKPLDESKVISDPDLLPSVL